MIGRRWPFHVFALVGIAPIMRRNASLSFCPCRLGDKDRRGRDGGFIDERSGRKGRGARTSARADAMSDDK